MQLWALIRYDISLVVNKITVLSLPHSGGESKGLSEVPLGTRDSGCEEDTQELQRNTPQVPPENEGVSAEGGAETCPDDT